MDVFLHKYSEIVMWLKLKVNMSSSLFFRLFFHFSQESLCEAPFLLGE
jgi:hypothetical protein